jgi:hypothetical protein
MKFRATNFLAAGNLPDRIRLLLEDYFAQSPAGTPRTWDELCAGHDDQAAALLAVLRSLSRVEAILGTGSAGGLDMVTSLHLLAGDRVYARLDAELFRRWRDAGGKFRIALEGNGTETGTVRFNHGGFGGSLHDGFDIQGVTSNTKVPRMQWNYRFCDSLADIDLDGFRPIDFFHHLTYANSDPRQWYDKYLAKFGNAGFDVENVGNVPELKVEDTSSCPAPEARISGAEAAAAREVALRFGRRLAEERAFAPLAEEFFAGDFPDRVLRDERASPLAPDVAPGAIREASTDDLMGYYLARGTLDHLERAAAVRGAPGPEVDRPDPESAVEGDSGIVETAGDLAAERARLEELVRRTAAESAAAEATGEPSLVRGITPPVRTWLSVSDTEAFGYPAGTRFVVVNLPDVQLLTVRDRDEVRVLSATPRGSV